MLRNFLIICICICCLISIFALTNNRWNYEGFRTAIAEIDDESDIIRDDFNTISLLSYFWGDRISITNDMYNQGYRIRLIPGTVDGAPALQYVYGIVNVDSNTGTLDDFTDIIEMHVFIYNDEKHFEDAYNLTAFVINHSSVLDMSDSESIFTDIAFGVVFLVQAIATILAILYTLIYILFDMFSVGVVVIRSCLWILGFS